MGGLLVKTSGSTWLMSREGGLLSEGESAIVARLIHIHQYRQDLAAQLTGRLRKTVSANPRWGGGSAWRLFAVVSRVTMIPAISHVSRLPPEWSISRLAARDPISVAWSAGRAVAVMVRAIIIGGRPAIIGVRVVVPRRDTSHVDFRRNETTTILRTQLMALDVLRTVIGDCRFCG